MKSFDSKMMSFNTVHLFNSILRAVAFICITVAAIHFGKVGVLWFYLVPMFMGIDYEKKGGEAE